MSTTKNVTVSLFPYNAHAYAESFTRAALTEVVDVLRFCRPLYRGGFRSGFMRCHLGGEGVAGDNIDPIGTLVGIFSQSYDDRQEGGLASLCQGIIGEFLL